MTMDPGAPPVSDRRPIAARRLKASQAAASWMARRGVSPNAISIAGMICGLLSGAALVLTLQVPDASSAAWIAAAALIQLRLLANMLDGMVAVERGVASRVGELFNEIPDRISDSATLIGLGYAAGGDPMLGYLAALAAMFTAYVRTTGKGAGAASEFCGPMAKQHRMFLVTVTALYCALAPADWQRFEIRSILATVPEATLVLIIAGSVITAWRRLRRIAGALKS
jgi:phosphatidylglycerophosphate synthase